MATKPPRPIAIDDFDEFGGDQISWGDLVGSLLFVQPLSIERGIKTVHDDEYEGPAERVAANVAVLDGEHGGTKYTNAIVFPKALVAQLKRCTMGRMTLGRLAQKAPPIDPATGEVKRGADGEPYNPTWTLEKPSEQDKVEARAWLAVQARTNRPKAV